MLWTEVNSIIFKKNNSQGNSTLKGLSCSMPAITKCIQYSHYLPVNIKSLMVPLRKVCKELYFNKKCMCSVSIQWLNTN